MQRQRRPRQMPSPEARQFELFRPQALGPEWSQLPVAARHQVLNLMAQLLAGHKGRKARPPLARLPGGRRDD